MEQETDVLKGRPVQVVSEEAKIAVREYFPSFEGYGIIIDIDLNRKDPFRIEFLLEDGLLIEGYFTGYMIEVIR